MEFPVNLTLSNTSGLKVKLGIQSKAMTKEWKILVLNSVDNYNAAQ